MARRTLLSIDPGIVHLGYVLVRGRHKDGARPAHMEVLRQGLVDLTRRVRGVPPPRSRELWDRLHHAYAHTLADPCAEADTIVIERQPPGGLGEIVSFFYERHPDKVVRVHPRSMHAFYGITGFDYDGRKVCVNTIARNWLVFDDSDARHHDIADAACMAYYHLSTAPPPRPAVDPAHWMDEFRYDPTERHENEETKRTT